jgi:hypothetical protein
LKNSVFDPIRNVFVNATPEEIVRQKLIKHMIKLNYPKNLIAVEKDIKSLSYIKENISKRRADILVFANDKTIYPLLLVECKKKLDKKAIDQALGYNFHINAYFVTIADVNTVFTYFYDNTKKEYVKIDYLPKYEKLLIAIS